MNRGEITFKATSFLAIIAFMKRRLSAQAYQNVLGDAATRFPNEVQRIRENRVLASDWFPLRMGIELIEQTAQELREPATSIAHQIGRDGAESATNTVLRFVIALISMASFLGKIQAVWSKLYSQGRITISVDGRTGTVQLDEFPYVSATNCARVTGSFEWYGQKAERTAVVRHVSCRSKGQESCRWAVTW